MGHYIGLKFKGYVKDKYKKDISDVFSFEKDWIDCENSELALLGTLSGAGCIPFRVEDCMHKKWAESSKEYNLDFNYENGLVMFSCTLKKDSDVLPIFIGTMFHKVCSEVVHCEELDEYARYSTIYVKDGSYVKTEKGVDYSC